MGVQTDIYPMEQTNILLSDSTAAHGNAKCGRGRRLSRERIATVSSWSTGIYHYQHQ